MIKPVQLNKFKYVLNLLTDLIAYIMIIMLITLIMYHVNDTFRHTLSYSVRRILSC